MTVLVLGDQLTRRVGPVAARPDDRVLLIEAREFARRLPYHPHKLTLVFGAMRAYRDELRDAGREVEYVRAETFREGLATHFDAHPNDDLTVMRPSSHGGAERLRRLVEREGGRLDVVDNDLFLCSRSAFASFASDRTQPYRHEEFYRFMRRKTGYLMADGEPVGGEWNYDDQNREFPDESYDPPDPPAYDPDERTREVAEWVREEFDGGYEAPPYGGDWADPEPFRWPVTRADALDALDRFVDERLAAFGPYQDAMLEDEWAMHHALLSVPLNLGLLGPDEVIERVLDGARADPDVPLNSVEGFVRQVLGWREFVRGVYAETMPELATANQLEASQALPEFYWTGETEMACLADAVDGVRKRGYSHHIQRLMVLSNFGLLYGVEPRRLNRWFHAGYVDAYHWVTTPNVVEMGLYGAGAFASKPYAASANYVDGMSDYCGGCAYDPDATTDEGACPFNALYWDFLDRNEERLGDNYRMGLVYSHLEDKDVEAIRERAETVRRMTDDGVV
ncbi:cryptochrome/photolyase family protein [Halorussus marinus]|uniref:cryptochrome/photolyase family protein n=1 Tax=Halorussus marinus TaxID=2505976 RepID=UPI001091E742|nr:cryptochrome/photolyase family protein [Halorussus marinus]